MGRALSLCAAGLLAGAAAVAPAAIAAPPQTDPAEPPPLAETVYLTKENALKLVFAASERVTAERHALSDEQVAAVEHATGRAVPEREYIFYVGRTGEHIDGYAFIDDQRGKYHPITFIAALSPEGEVTRVEVMLYRESIGDTVRHRRFLKQFDGKGANDIDSFRRTIRIVSGATISSDSLMFGVARAVALWQELYAAGPSTSAPVAPGR